MLLERMSFECAAGGRSRSAVVTAVRQRVGRGLVAHRGVWEQREGRRLLTDKGGGRVNERVNLMMEVTFVDIVAKDGGRRQV